MSPPLKRIQLPAGKHVVEVRSGALKPLVVDLAIGPGEEFSVQHVFVTPPPPPPPPAKPAPKPGTKARPQQQQPQQKQQEQKTFWDRVKDWFYER